MNRLVIFFLALSCTAFSQQIVEGTIVDSSTGSPVPFASVAILETSKGTSSNVRGQFSISVSPPVSLMITCIGYESKRVDSVTNGMIVRLTAKATQLSAVVILNKPVDAGRIVRKAFQSVGKNYEVSPFLQTFFYRHYCKDDGVYGRLIEASVDIWKPKGYRMTQKAVGEKDEVRVTQLRRSLDKTALSAGHEAISVGSVLEMDLIGYQSGQPGAPLSFHTNVSNLKEGLDDYTFTYNGVTSYDGVEVYEIAFSYKRDSVLTTSGKYLQAPQNEGKLFVSTDTHAIIKAEQAKTFEQNTVRTSISYRKYNNRYYPYHFRVQGEDHGANKHTFHIELMSVEIKSRADEAFTGKLPGRDELLKIPYDSIFWTSNTTLKTTPLEDTIIRDLGGGRSLNEQFHRYRQFELNIRDGGVNATEKFNWLRADSKGNRILYVVIWSDDFQSYWYELELAKKLNKEYRSNITFVFLSIDDDQNRWQQKIQKYNLSSDGIINYRIGSRSPILTSFNIGQVPGFILISHTGDLVNTNAKRPGDPVLKQDFDELIRLHH